MNLKHLFQDFNPGNFLIYSSLLLFSILFALKADSYINCSWWLVFLPLWIWKLLVFSGAIIGGFVWWKHPEYRIEGEGYVDMKAIIISVALHSLVFIFEVLVCDNLENMHNVWLVVFMPLFMTAPISIAACVWGFKHDRGLEFETMCAINILQFIFIALKLDAFINWSWAIVFIPIWIIMGLLCMVDIIWSILIFRATETMPEQRRAHVMTAFARAVLVVPLLTFEILLVNRLEGINDYPLPAIFCPLYLSLLVLLPTSFGQRGNNQWWFGIRMDFCSFLLEVCPCLQEYGNITYTLHPVDVPPETEQIPVRSIPNPNPMVINTTSGKLVAPVTTIDMPD
ncbi:transmembrane protein 185A-like [Anneissia japonica]|uniref:transmembrane protein 185A-like n=1 Tax=Anneissia japonica TaxID=1529436 RepID=UPI0014257041|nr:transmembrane protein 185A-like [Anneissia japonica]